MNISRILNDDNNHITLTMTLSRFEFSDLFAQCGHCGKIMLLDDAVEVDGEYYCDDCVTECDCCGRTVVTGELYTVEDSSDMYCEDCYHDHTYVCDDCGEHFRYDDSLICGDDDNYYCEQCYPRHSGSVISSYHDFKDYGEIRFYGKETREEAVHMGFELEIDSTYSIDPTPSVSFINNLFPSDYFHFEHDGSLHYGFENISQPASLSYHLGQMNNYRRMFEYAASEGYRSHDVGTCGFHIHIDRRFFGKNEDTSIAKLLYIFEKFRSELLAFSRRKEGEVERWARPYKNEYTQKQWIKKTVKDSRGGGCYSDRYHAVNLTNCDTIEIRLWKGTLNPETFEATLKFTSRLAEICRDTQAVALASMTFEELLGDDPIVLSYWDRVKDRNTSVVYGGEQ